jgi:geranylgeranyl pyrophosphate synthase
MSELARSTAWIERVDRELDTWLPPSETSPASLREAMRYVVFNGGKRIRPQLCFAAAGVLGQDDDRAVPIAAAIELIHCYSLVHDDLPAMDDDDLRRGQPTVHKAWDEATAILAGDALLTLAFGGLARSGAPSPVIAGLADAAGSAGMVGGQSLDLAFEHTTPDTALLETMFRGKTGALIRAAVELPALLEPAPAELRSALADYGDAIGVAFQVVDDLLDVEGSTEQLGKPAGSDVQQGKATWPGLNGIPAARARAEELLGTARAALDRLPAGPARDDLAALGALIVKRSF